jgi:hypothetical protein
MPGPPGEKRRKMRKSFIMATIITVSVVLSSSIATAQQGQNEIPITAKCDNRQTYDLTVVAEGQSLKTEGPDHFVVLRSTFDLFDAATRENIDTIIFDAGKKTGLEGDLVQCKGTVTTTLFKIGEVKIKFTFEALVT